MNEREGSDGIRHTHTYIHTYTCKYVGSNESRGEAVKPLLQRTVVLVVPEGADLLLGGVQHVHVQHHLLACLSVGWSNQ